MTLDDLSNVYHANEALAVSLAALIGVVVLLVAANRLRSMKEHRATLLVANLLTVVAAALATMVSASGMWKFFTDILGPTPLRVAFFAFIEIALFASALLARSRLLREPDKGSTGIDGIAVWVLAGLTATLSALDSDSFREVCLRLVAPLVAAWMWERALAAERTVRLGKTATRINWTITPQRIFVWLRLAEAHDRNLSDIDRARRRARLGRARLHLHLLQDRKAYAWRIRRAHRKVVAQAMQAAEHLGLADFPDAHNEREAIQMYMATLYGFVDATSPQAVAHLGAWRTPIETAGMPSSIVNGTKVTAMLIADRAEQEQVVDPAASRSAQAAPAFSGPTDVWNEIGAVLGEAAANSDNRGESQSIFPDFDQQRESIGEPANGAAHRAPPSAVPDDDNADNEYDDEQPIDEEDDSSAVAAMRRFWDSEVAKGRIPTGAELSRAAGVLPSTGLGRRKRREWEADLPDSLRSAVGAD